MVRNSSDADSLYVGLDPEKISIIEYEVNKKNFSLVVEIVEGLHAADVADLIENISPEHLHALVDILQSTLNPEVLTKLDDNILRRVIEQLGADQTAEAISGLDTDEAVEVLDDLDKSTQQELLARLEGSERESLEKVLSFPEDSAGRLMKKEVMTIPDFWNVGKVIDHLRETDELPNEFYELLIVDANFHPIGIVPLNTLLRSKRPVKVIEIMKLSLKKIPFKMDQEEVAYLFQQYDLVSAPVVDEEGKLIGVIMHDDIVDVIQEEAEDDILRLGRVGEAGINDPIITITRNRFVWLLVNLITAAIASYVIFLFDATIEQLVALAVLMPIVASMGGNAGTQTLTVTVRALASRDINSSNAVRHLNKELVVAVLNGAVFACIVASVSWLWFENFGLAVVIFFAMIINMFAAGLSGIIIPLGLHKIGADPALAATVFVTTVTDVLGFFAFLGLAAVFLI